MRRREFSVAIKREAFDRSGGICECHRVWQLPSYRTGCGNPLSDGNTFYEHIEPDHLGGSPTLDNCAVLTKTCWRLKTDGYDRPTITKADHQRDRNAGIRPIPTQTLPGTRRSGIKLPFRGPPIDRATGLPWRGRS
jgi:5-methylcytosine-specific restriction protein A